LSTRLLFSTISSTLTLENDVETGLYVRGLVIGFSIAAPVGPIGVLCIRRTLASGQLAGLASGLGAATADAIYGCIAAFGLTFVSGFLISRQDWLGLVGGLFLCYLGVRTFRSRPEVAGADAGYGGLAAAYASTFFLTLTNPMTILSFAAVFAGLGVGASSGGYAGALLTVCGVFCGSALWWLVLSFGVGLLRRQIDQPKMMLINRISGIIIVGFGVLALLSIVPAIAGPLL
jgi:threonine/homoserine/homoserine lactone efflux protein